jgi:hypothetical protein
LGYNFRQKHILNGSPKNIILFICHRMKYVRFNLLAAVLLAAVTMLLSEITQNQLATICG